MAFIGFHEGASGKVVKGAPYHAEVVSEVVQTLADGNRIVRKTTGEVYRDGEGRTRREHTFAALGPFVASGDPPSMVFLSDPVAGVNYALEMDQKVARKRPALTAKKPVAGADDAEPEDVTFAAGPGMPGLPFPAVAFHHKAGPKPATESLGRKTIEGLEADGTRTTLTIPAGDIGNERPLQIVTERWYSPDLQTVVLSHHSDPRFGDTTFRLANVSRGEPDHALFEVPEGFSVQDGPPAQFRHQMRKQHP